MMQTMMPWSAMHYHHDDYKINSKEPVSFNDMQRQPVSDSQFRHVANNRNANMLIYSVHKIPKIMTQDLMCTETIKTETQEIYEIPQYGKPKARLPFFNGKNNTTWQSWYFAGQTVDK